MLAARLSGEPVTTELPLPKFDRVDPAPPLARCRTATIVLATEGGLAPQGNPDGIEMSMATRFGCYSLEGMDRMDPALFAVAHGGYDNRVAQEDPNRLLPLDVLREFEREKAIGRVADVFYTTVRQCDLRGECHALRQRPSPRISASASRKMSGSYFTAT